MHYQPPTQVSELRRISKVYELAQVLPQVPQAFALRKLGSKLAASLAKACAWGRGGVLHGERGCKAARSLGLARPAATHIRRARGRAGPSKRPLACVSGVCACEARGWIVTSAAGIGKG